MKNFVFVLGLLIIISPIFASADSISSVNVGQAFETLNWRAGESRMVSWQGDSLTTVSLYLCTPSVLSISLTDTNTKCLLIPGLSNIQSTTQTLGLTSFKIDIGALNADSAFRKFIDTNNQTKIRVCTAGGHCLDSTRYTIYDSSHPLSESITTGIGPITFDSPASVIVGNSKTIYWSKSSFDSTSVDIWLCHKSGVPAGPMANTAGVCIRQLAPATPNDGSEQVTIPDVSTITTPENYFFYVRKGGDTANAYPSNNFSSAIYITRASQTGGTPVLNGASFSSLGSNWVGGTSKTITVNGVNLGSNQLFDVKVCHPTNTSVACGTFTNTASCSGNSCTIVTSNIGPKLSESNSQFFNSDKKTTMLKVCLKGTANCKTINFTYTPAYNGEAPAIIKVSMIAIPGLPMDSWIQGDSRVFEVGYKNFPIGSNSTQSTVDIASFFCDKTGNVCSIVGGTQNPTRVKVRPGSNNYFTLSESIGSKALSNDALRPYIDPITKEARFKICPISNLNLPTFAPLPSGVTLASGYLVGSNCTLSPVFKIKDYNQSDSSTFGLKSGAGCMVGECVCVNGMRKKCGNPMQSGASSPSCPTNSSNYPRGVCSGLGIRDKMVASVITGFSQVLSAFSLNQK